MGLREKRCTNVKWQWAWRSRRGQLIFAPGAHSPYLMPRTLKVLLPTIIGTTVSLALWFDPALVGTLGHLLVVWLRGQYGDGASPCAHGEAASPRAQGLALDDPA